LKLIDSAALASKKSVNLRSKLLRTIIKAVHEKKGENLISLNLKEIPEAIADYFIICEASNVVQLNAIREEIFDKVRENCGEKPYRSDGKRGDDWLLLDYINVVVHCMMPQSREYYNLEELWHDAERKDHNIK